MKPSLKTTVIKHLEAQYGPQWEYAGKLCREIHELTGTKEGVIERHGLRKLREQGILEVQYVQVEGTGPKVAQYRLMPMEIFTSHGVVHLPVLLDNQEREVRIKKPGDQLNLI